MSQKPRPRGQGWKKFLDPYIEDQQLVIVFGPANEQQKEALDLATKAYWDFRRINEYFDASGSPSSCPNALSMWRQANTELKKARKLMTGLGMDDLKQDIIIEALAAQSSAKETYHRWCGLLPEERKKEK